MKKESITLLVLLGLIFAGCENKGRNNDSQDNTPGGEVDPGGDVDPSGDVTPEEIPEGDVFFTAKNRLYEKHNYTVKVTTTVEDDEDSPYVDRFYNINNKAYFAVNSEYPLFYSGFIYQKDQGYVDFDLVIEGDEVAPSNFYSTDPTKSVSDIYTLAIERVLDGHFMKEGDQYSCAGRDPVAVMTNLSGFDTTYITSPEKIYATVDSENNLRITCDFVMWYIDETTVEQVSKNGTVTVEFENIDNTHNAAVEAYIENPTTVYNPRIAWTASDRKEFEDYYNGRVPPFLEGSSYSLKVGDYYDGYSQEVYAIIEDYACGDLSESYGELLKDSGYTKTDRYHYKLEQTISSGTIIET